MSSYEYEKTHSFTQKKKELIFVKKYLLAKDKDNQKKTQKNKKTAQTQASEAAKKEEIDKYKSQCKTLDYKKIQRSPSDYKNKYIKMSGKVIQVSEGWFSSVDLRVEDSDKNVWFVTYFYKDGDKHILKNDKITVYGQSSGTTTYKSVIGASVTIPSISAKYIDIK